MVKSKVLPHFNLINTFVNFTSISYVWDRFLWEIYIQCYHISKSEIKI